MVRRTNSMRCCLSFLIVVLVVYFNISETECKGQKVGKVKEKSDGPTADKKPYKPKPEFDGKPSETLTKSTFEKKNGKYADGTAKSGKDGQKSLKSSHKHTDASSESSNQTPDIKNDPNSVQNAERKLEKPKRKIAKPNPNSDYGENSDERSHSTKSHHESRSKSTKSTKSHSKHSRTIPDYSTETTSTGSSGSHKINSLKSGDHSDSSRSSKTSQTGSSKNTNLGTESVTPVNDITEDFNVENTEASEPITPGTAASVTKDTTKVFTESTTSETTTTSTVSASETAAYTTSLLSELESEPGTEHGLSNESKMELELLHVIKPPYPSRRMSKERTPPCCIGGQLELNLGTIGIKGRVLGELDGVKTEISDQPQKRFTRCSFSAKIKVSFEQLGSEGCFGCIKAPFCGRRLLQLELDLSRNKRRNTLFYISDSSFENEGASVLAEYPNVTIHPRHAAENRTSQIRIQGAINAYTNKLTIFVGNQFIRLMNDKRLDENFCDNDLFHLNGQFDPGNGGMSPNEITIGINRAVSSGAVSSEEDPASFGVCSAKVKWACPWQDS